MNGRWINRNFLPTLDVTISHPRPALTIRRAEGEKILRALIELNKAANFQRFSLSFIGQKLWSEPCSLLPKEMWPILDYVTSYNLIEGHVCCGNNKSLCPVCPDTVICAKIHQLFITLPIEKVTLIANISNLIQNMAQSTYLTTNVQDIVNLSRDILAIWELVLEEDEDSTTVEVEGQNQTFTDDVFLHACLEVKANGMQYFIENGVWYDIISTYLITHGGNEAVVAIYRAALLSKATLIHLQGSYGYCFLCNQYECCTSKLWIYGHPVKILCYQCERVARAVIAYAKLLIFSAESCDKLGSDEVKEKSTTALFNIVKTLQENKAVIL
jgi:hypothetical protein